MTPFETFKLGVFCALVIGAFVLWLMFSEWLPRRLWPPREGEGPERYRRRDAWFRRLLVGGPTVAFVVPALLFFAARDDWAGKLQAWREPALLQPPPVEVAPFTSGLRPEADVAPARS
jgi:hypothetical protein